MSLEGECREQENSSDKPREHTHFHKTRDVTFRQLGRSVGCPKTSTLAESSNSPTVEVESCSLGRDAKPIYSIKLLGGVQLNAKPSEAGGDRG